MKQQMIGWQWHQLDYIQIISNSLQTVNDASTQFFTGQMLFLMSSHQCKSTEGKLLLHMLHFLFDLI